MHVIAYGQQVAIAAVINRLSFVTSGEKMAAGFVADVETFSVNAQQPFHAGDQVWLRRLDHQMKMVPHQAIGMDLPFGLATGFSEGGKEALAIIDIAKDVL